MDGWRCIAVLTPKRVQSKKKKIKAEKRNRINQIKPWDSKITAYFSTSDHFFDPEVILFRIACEKSKLMDVQAVNGGSTLTSKLSEE